MQNGFAFNSIGLNLHSQIIYLNIDIIKKWEEYLK